MVKRFKSKPKCEGQTVVAIPPAWLKIETRAKIVMKRKSKYNQT